MFFPEERPYDSYRADPLMNGMSTSLVHMTDVEVRDSGSPRISLKMGGSFGFLRLANSGWQFSVEAGFNGIVDADKGYDVMGWDGIAGLMAARGLPHGLSLRLSPYMHRSSHLGDELIERTGRKRIEYTREEYAAGLAWSFRRHWRLYGDAGYAYTNRSTFQKRWRVQGGAEWVHPSAVAGGKAGLYAAVNGTSFQEDGWDVDLTAAAGFLFRVNERDWRLGVLFHHGSVPLGEFFQVHESFVAAGAWLDL